MYAVLRKILFNLDPEQAHDLVMNGLAQVSQSKILLSATRAMFAYHHPALAVERFGLTFANPIGLAAGLDKNARAIQAWQALGFGFSEVGTITAHAQEGNPKPRLFRLPEDKALINRMGFNNAGAESVASHLSSQTLPSIPLGINVGKSKITELDHASEDYLSSISLLRPYANYFVLNVSSPNTPNLRQLQDKDKLSELLYTVTSSPHVQNVPVLLKIAPDLNSTQLDEVLDLTMQYALKGLILTNTTLSRAGLSTPSDEQGGLSGKPLQARSLQMLKYARQAVGKHVALVSVGGIFTPEDAYIRLKAGASLLQIYTSFIYQGPSLPATLCKGIVERLKADGFSRLEDAIGTDA